MRSWLVIVFFLLGCSGEPETGPAIEPEPATGLEPEPELELEPDPAPDPRVDLLPDELERPETLGDPDLRLEMPELGSDLPPVIFVPSADPPEGR